jgi:quercetin 2,3-dioxygenase
MIRIRRAEERGRFDHGWLKTAHTFSFADYYDPANTRFRNLRVMNEDFIDGGAGFPPHGHRDMEIVTYVLEGALEHQDSMGNHGIIRPGIVQRMSAGTGVQHSEFNALQDRTTHLYQIWIFPREKGIKPDYEERELPGFDQAGKLILVASPDGDEASALINADARLYAAKFKPGQQIAYTLPQGHGGWLQVTRGEVTLNGQALKQGDGAAIEDVNELSIQGVGDSEILLFDLD